MATGTYVTTGGTSLRSLFAPLCQFVPVAMSGVLGGPLGGAVGGALHGTVRGALGGMQVQQQETLQNVRAQQALLANVPQAGRTAYLAAMQQDPGFNGRERQRLIERQYDADPVQAWLDWGAGTETLGEWLDREGL